MINADTKILGLIGYPLGHTISPLLHNYSLNENNLNYIYLPFPVENDKLADAITGFKAINFRGLNVTIPHKESVIPLLDNIDPIAKKIGAVNTILNDKGILTGYNTDVTGLIRMIEEDGNFNIKGKTAMLIGAGGAARAAGIALLEEGISELYLLNRTASKAENLTAEWKEHYPLASIYYGSLNPDSYKSYIDSVELLIDTTPRGMEPNVDVPPVITTEYLHSNMLVVDLVYNPKETTLIKAAKSAHADYLNGMGMLLYQGIDSFKIWTGIDIDADRWWSLV